MDASDDRIDSLADKLLAEGQAPDAAVAKEQAEAMLDDSDLREDDRDAAPDTHLEHRTSQDTVPPA